MDYRMIVFDVDGTLIDDTEYIWVTLHEAFGVPRELCRRHFEDFMAGRITYERWFELDIREWMARKRKKSDFIEIIRRLRPMRGAVETVETLRRRGYRIAVISGSLSLVLETLLPDLRFDDVLINRLVFDEDGTLTGGIATRFDMVHKATGLRTIARREGIPLSRCVYVGDNENDVHVAEAAGFSIAFNSKSRNLERVSNRIVPEKNLRRILEYL